MSSAAWYLVPTLGTAFILFGSYIVTSAILYYYPNLLHKNHKNGRKKSKLLVVSHRGGAGENNENTLTAFQHSKNIGVDIVELDCHITKDGQVVVSHDNNLLRSAGVDKLISDLNYDELPLLLNDSYVIPFSKGYSDDFTIYKSPNKQTADSNKIPLLEDVFRNFPSLPVNIDMKINNNELIEKINNLIKKYDRENITVWGSFNDKVTSKCYKLNKNVEMYFSLKGVVRLLILNLTGLLPFVPIKESYLEIIMPNMILRNNADIPGLYKCGLWLVKIFFIRKSFIRHLQKRGILVYYWVLNTNEEYECAFNLGVDGIITDYPTKLLKFLEDFTKCN